MLECKNHDFPENPDTNQENPDSLQSRNELKSILNDINHIILRIANKDAKSAKLIVKNVDKIESAIQNNSEREDLEILLIRVRLQIQHCDNLFGGHETSASHFCNYLINKIDEFLEP